jgi:2-methylcitrate dehydratase PrpD
MVGVMAADLAAAGFRGPPGIIDGPFGIAALMSDAPDLDAMVRGLGTTFEFGSTALKPYPSCRFTHGPIHEAIRLRNAHDLRPDRITRLELAAFRQSIEVSDKRLFSSRTEAMLSHQFTVAVALRKGGFALDDLDERTIADPAVRALAARIQVIHDPALDAQYPAAWPHHLRIVLDDGRTLQAVSANPPGGIDQPMRREQIVAKYLANAAPVLGEDRAHEVMAHVASLAELNNVRLLGFLLRSPSSHTVADERREPADVAE